MAFSPAALVVFLTFCAMVITAVASGPAAVYAGEAVAGILILAAISGVGTRARSR